MRDAIYHRHKRAGGEECWNRLPVQQRRVEESSRRNRHATKVTIDSNSKNNMSLVMDRQ